MIYCLWWLSAEAFRLKVQNGVFLFLMQETCSIRRNCFSALSYLFCC